MASCGGSAASGSVLSPVALSIGQTAPSLSGTSIDGTTVDLSAFRGRPVIVNFWASWCLPCRDEFGLFRSALSRHAGERLEVVGVVFKDDASAAGAFARAQGAGWPNLVDPSGSIASTFRVVAPPQTYFIDRNGVVKERQIGEILTDAEMDQLLTSIL